MKRLMSLLAIGLISANVGCTLCSNCDDYSYGGFGGLWERSDLTYGRVGSAFAPEGVIISEGPSEEAATEENSALESVQPGEGVPVEPPSGDDAPAGDDPAEEFSEDSALET